MCDTAGGGVGPVRPITGKGILAVGRVVTAAGFAGGYGEGFGECCLELECCIVGCVQIVVVIVIVAGGSDVGWRCGCSTMRITVMLFFIFINCARRRSL